MESRPDLISEMHSLEAKCRQYRQEAKERSLKMQQLLNNKAQSRHTTEGSQASHRRSSQEVAPASPMRQPSAGEIQASQAVEADTKPFLEEKGFLDVLYRPHTIFGLCVGISFIIYSAFFRSKYDDHDEERIANVKLGLFSAAAVFLLYCYLHLRDSLFLRPHPVVWRFVQGLLILYMMLLTYLLMQSPHEARMVMKFFDSNLGVEPVENHKSYANDCRIYTPGHPKGDFAHVKDTFYDVFFVAHFIGWWGKALIIRDWTFLWAASLVFEILEMTFQHMLPNFAECWWDKWVYDALGCNFAGMLLGLATCRYFEMKEYNWTGVKGRVSFNRLLLQFTPKTWTKFEWDYFSSVKRFSQLAFVMIVIMSIELNAFFLKYALWIPPENPLVTIRLLLWWLLAMPAVGEYYHYVSNRSVKRLGPNTWLSFAGLAFEVLLIIKMAPESYPNMFPFPAYINHSYLAFFIIFSVWGYLFVSYRAKKKVFDKSVDERKLEGIVVPEEEFTAMKKKAFRIQILGYCCWLPFVYMGVYDYYMRL
mmetsp:Transcript_18317/g.45884  ORF Transcript_18317/g.45884 Transcript_18317/m.45884 type:complete len:534 (-) Transcript_18317:183-1784(-)